MRRTVLIVLLASACGGGGRSSSTPVAATTPPPSRDVRGQWQGTFVSAQGVTGSLSASLSQTGGSISGPLCVKNSRCFTQGTLSGTTVGDWVAFGASFSDSQQLNFSGIVTTQGSGMSGTYAVVGGQCAGEGGNWTIARTTTDLTAGKECDLCSVDENCSCPFVCSRFSDGSSRCGSGLGATTCRIP